MRRSLIRDYDGLAPLMCQTKCPPVDEENNNNKNEFAAGDLSSVGVRTKVDIDDPRPPSVPSNCLCQQLRSEPRVDARGLPIRAAAPSERCYDDVFCSRTRENTTSGECLG